MAKGGRDMTQEMIEIYGLLKERHRLVIKRYEMSKATFRQLELQMKGHLVPLRPDEQRATSLWGIPIYIDNAIPLGEIKPVYAQCSHF